MKTKYLFCLAEHEITRDTLFVSVYVGKSLQDNRDANFIASLSMCTQFLWHQYSTADATFLVNVAKSLYPDEQHPVNLIPQVTLQVGELRRLLKSCHYQLFAKTYVSALRSCSSHRLSLIDSKSIARSRAMSISCIAADVVNLKPGRAEI